MQMEKNECSAANKQPNLSKEGIRFEPTSIASIESSPQVKFTEPVDLRTAVICPRVEVAATPAN